MPFEIIGHVEKSVRERVVVRIADTKTGLQIDLRIYDRTGPEFFPSKQGFSLHPDDVPVLCELLRTAVQQMSVSQEP